MGQHQFKRTLSVSTRLLLSGMLLLAGVIIFLNFSITYLLQEDKVRFIFQTQNNTAALASQYFSYASHRTVDAIQMILDAPQLAQRIIDNQVNAPEVIIFELNRQTLELKKVREIRSNVIPRIHTELEPEARLRKESPTVWMDELLAKGESFINPSIIKGLPLLGVLAAHPKTATQAPTQNLEFGFAILPLENLGQEMSGLRLSIATRKGEVLYDTSETAQFYDKSVTADPLFDRAVTSQLSSGTMDYVWQGKRFLATYLNAQSGLVVLVRTEWSSAMVAVKEITLKFILAGIVSILLAAVSFSVIFSKTLRTPINRLYRATKEVMQGNFDLNLEVTSRDELGDLTQSFNRMSKRVAELITEQKEKSFLDNELQIAATVQQTFIPPQDHETSRIRISGHYQTATTCGGDWWGFFEAGDKMSLMIGDAIGHGLPSALITASVRSCFSVMQKLAQEEEEFAFSPKAMLSYANRVVYEASLGKILMTFFIATIDFSKMTLTYSNAGQNPPWLFRKQPDGSFKQNSLISRSIRLGEELEYNDFQEVTVPISVGDILFLYTDGLVEGKNLAGEMYGKKRARDVVSEGLSQGPHQILAKLVADFQAHNAGKPLDDDLTLAVAEVLGLRG